MRLRSQPHRLQQLRLLWPHRQLRLRLRQRRPRRVGEGAKVEAPMPGTILEVKVAVGDTVKAGQPVVVLEAMKMENDIVAPVDGKVTSIVVKKGDAVNSGDVMATIA